MARGLSLVFALEKFEFTGGNDFLIRHSVVTPVGIDRNGTGERGGSHSIAPDVCDSLYALSVEAVLRLDAA